MFISKNRLCKSFILFITITCIFAGADLFAGDIGNPEIVPYIDSREEIDPCAGRGLYKPFKWYRRFPYVASAFTEPDKFMKIKIVKTYPLQGVMKFVVPKIESEEIQFIGVLTPSNDESILTIVPIKCLQKSELSAMYELKAYPISDIVTPLEWLQNLDENSVEKLYIISEVIGKTNDKDMLWISWDHKSPVEPEAPLFKRL